MKSPITNEDAARKQEGLWAVGRATTLNELRLIWKLYRHPEVREAATERAKQIEPATLQQDGNEPNQPLEDY